jgi:hypothetical protein
MKRRGVVLEEVILRSCEPIINVRGSRNVDVSQVTPEYFSLNFSELGTKVGTHTERE